MKYPTGPGGTVHDDARRLPAAGAGRPLGRTGHGPAGRGESAAPTAASDCAHHTLSISVNPGADAAQITSLQTEIAALQKSISQDSGKLSALQNQLTAMEQREDTDTTAFKQTLESEERNADVDTELRQQNEVDRLWQIKLAHREQATTGPQTCRGLAS